MDISNLNINGSQKGDKNSRIPDIQQNPKATENISEKERVKKIRIPKVEGELGGKQEKVTLDYFRWMAKNYIRDRLRRLSQDKESFEKIKSMNPSNEKMTNYIDERLTGIIEEQKKLREKLKKLEKGKMIYLETDIGKKTVSNFNLKKILSSGILLFCMGGALIYIGSEYGLLIAYGILFITALVSTLIMSILGVF